MTRPATFTARQVATGALAWLHAHHTCRAFPAGETPETVELDRFYKPLGEMALAASLMVREGVADREDLRCARGLLEFAWQQFDQGDMLYERQLRHLLLADPLEQYVHFARVGYRHLRLDELLAHTATLVSARGAEVMPNRRLAVANAARVVGIPRDDDWEALTRATWLGNTPEPWAVDWMTGYCITHTVFHLTDWAAVPAGLPADIESYLHAWLPVWIDVWREVHQWDLVAELLIVGACLREPYCPAQHWQALAERQHPDGMVPRDGDPVAEDVQQRFEDHEHTAVVSIVAGTLTVARTTSPAD